ncbi:DUF7738 domain-containing protein [Patiriisocius marinus]|uniref:DUF7738 domain-containing protein n=1 Tax=Patiriisocius marinus TaxID=1397112 RepID=UPI00232D5029|nr:hypothetical protein [Patiriisocius marinus]
MRKTLLFSAFLLFVSLLQAQEVNLEFVNENKVLLNGVKLDTTTTLDDIIKVLGEPVVYKAYPTGKTNYHYENLGISVHAVDGQLLFMGANFNWDGDANFPESSFIGLISIDGVSFTKQSNETIMEKVENITFISMMPGFYISKPLTETNKAFAVIGFKNDLVTQVGFEFH